MWVIFAKCVSWILKCVFKGTWPIWFWGTADYVLVRDHQWSNFISEQKMDRVCWNSFCYLFKLHNWHCRNIIEVLWQNNFSLFILGVFRSLVFNLNIITQMKKSNSVFSEITLLKLIWITFCFMDRVSFLKKENIYKIIKFWN